MDLKSEQVPLGSGLVEEKAETFPSRVGDETTQACPGRDSSLEGGLASATRGWSGSCTNKVIRLTGQEKVAQEKQPSVSLHIF